MSYNLMEYFESYKLMNVLSEETSKYRLQYDSMDDVAFIMKKDDHLIYKRNKFAFPFCLIIPPSAQDENLYEIRFNLHIDDDRELLLKLVENELKMGNCARRYILGGSAFKFKVKTIEETISLIAKYVWGESNEQEQAIS